MTEINSLSLMPCPHTSSYNIQSEKSMVCSSKPPIADADIAKLELYYTALGLDLFADGSVAASYTSGGEDALGSKGPLVDPIRTFFVKYDYKKIYDTIKSSFTSGFRTYFESKVGPYEEANTPNKFKQIKAIRAMLLNPPRQMQPSDQPKLELFFQALGLDLFADGSVAASYTSGGEDALGSKGPLVDPIRTFFVKYDYKKIYDTIKSSFTFGFRTYFESKVGPYEEANTPKKFEQIKTIQGILASAHPSFCLAFTADPTTAQKDREVEIKLTASNGVFPDNPEINFYQGTNQSDKIATIGTPALSPDKKTLTIKIKGSEASATAYDIRVKDKNLGIIEAILEKAITITEGTPTSSPDQSLKSANLSVKKPATWATSGADFIQNRLKLELKTAIGFGGFSGRKPSQAPYDSRASMENRPFAARESLKLRLPLWNKQGETLHDDTFANKYVESEIPLELEYQHGVHSNNAPADLGRLHTGADLKFNLFDKHFTINPYFFYTFANNEYKSPNQWFFSGTSHKLAPGIALSGNFDIKGLPISITGFGEYNQNKFHWYKETQGYYFTGEDRAARFGGRLKLDFSKLVTDENKESFFWVPDLSVAIAGTVGEHTSPLIAPGLSSKSTSPMDGLEFNIRLDAPKWGEYKPYVFFNYNKSPYASTRYGYPGFLPNQDINGGFGLSLNGSSTIEATLGSNHPLTPYYRDEQPFYIQISATLPEKQWGATEKILGGRLKAIQLMFRYNQYQDRNSQPYHGLSGHISVDILKAIFGTAEKAGTLAQKKTGPAAAAAVKDEAAPPPAKIVPEEKASPAPAPAARPTTVNSGEAGENRAVDEYLK